MALCGMAVVATAFAREKTIDVYAAQEPGSRVDLPKSEWRKDFVLTCRASFAKDAPRQLSVKVFYPQKIGDAPARWRSISADIDFCFWTLIKGATKEPCGTPNCTREYMDLSVPDGEWRKVVVVGHDGYVSVFIEMNGRLQRTKTAQPSGDFQCAGVSVVPAAGVTVKDVKLHPFEAKYLPKGVDGFEVATTPKTVEIPVSGNVTSFDFIPGGYPVVVGTTFIDGTNTCTASFKSFSQDFNLRIRGAEARDKEYVELSKTVKVNGYRRIADSGMDFTCEDVKLPIYTITKMGGRYRGMQIYHMLTNLTAHGEVAAKHIFRCEVRKMADGMRLYVDGDYCCHLPLQRVEKILLRLPEGGMWALHDEARGKTSGRECGFGAEKFKSQLEPIVFEKPFDTSVCCVNLGNHSLECDGYLSRCPQEADPTSFLRRIPLGTYLRARVCCRLGGNTNRNTCVTARITNFLSGNSSGRSPECLDQQTKEIPRGTKGVVELTFNFDPGSIQDVIWSKGFKDLTFEVLGDCVRRHAYPDTNYLHPCGTSDVIVLGAVLERSPAGMHVANGTYGNLFYPSETPGFEVTVESLVAGAYIVEWALEDVRGKPCGKVCDKMSLRAGERRTYFRELARGDAGWYGVTATLKDAEGNVLVTHKASYVLLAPDTRKAGYESPWFSWTGLGLHVTSLEAFTNAMELCRRCGVRHAQTGAYGEKEAEPWGITVSPIPFSYGFSNAETPKEREAYYEKSIQSFMRRFPHASAATIFHESNCKTRRGQPPDVEHDREEVRKGAELCRVWRRLYPNVRLVLGNSGSSIDKLDQLFRAGFPKDLIDTMGEESVGGPVSSETTVSYNFMALRDLAREYGYDKLQPEGCYEWKSRPIRNFDSPRQLAAMRARDGILALAWGSRNITTSVSPEPNSCYITTTWGGGSFTRKPDCHPYPSAAAVATMTLVLDRCNYSRLVPTGSDSVYAVEFTNPDGLFVTALWTSKGSVNARVRGQSHELHLTDLYGVTRDVTGHLRAEVDLSISEEPVYITSSAPLKEVRLEGLTRDYQFERYVGTEDARELNRVPASGWIVDTRPLLGSSTLAGTNYVLRGVTDAEKGSVVELERGNGNKGKTIGGIRLKDPVVLPEGATMVGVWVKGNSSRGDVDFIVEDADGDEFHSSSRWGTRDWCEKLRLDFDGWRCVWMPLSDESPVRIYTHCMDVSQLWRCGKWRKQQMHWPVKIKGVSFSWGDEIVYVNEKRAVTNQSVRIGSFVTSGAKTGKIHP